MKLDYFIIHMLPLPTTFVLKLFCMWFLFILRFLHFFLEHTVLNKGFTQQLLFYFDSSLNIYLPK